MTPLKTIKLLLSESGTRFSDQDIEAVIDRHRAEVRSERLGYERDHDGHVHLYQSAYRDWGEATLTDMAGNAVDTAGADVYLEIGRWLFPDDTPPPLYATGYVVDTYSAAATVLESLAAKYAEDLQSFSGQNGSFTLAAKYRSYMELAARFRERATATTPAPASATIRLGYMPQW